MRRVMVGTISLSGPTPRRCGNVGALRTPGPNQRRENRRKQLTAGANQVNTSVITARNEAINMVLELKLRKVGNSLAVILPKEALARLHAGDGDSLFITEAPEGSFRLTSADPNFGRQMQAAEKVMRRYRNTLRELAK